MKETVRVGCFAAFWGDTRMAIRDILDGADVDYLVSDYLSEITMALLARSKAKNQAGGFVADFVTTVAPVLSDTVARGIKIVTNAGGLNPAACARALAEAAREQGLELTIATVEGDDLLDRQQAVLAADPRDMATGVRIPSAPSSLNAYLGARPIAVALDRGADVVITGRCVDAAVVLGPLMHEFGWADDDYDLLAAGTLVGHIVECGPQATGGNVTDWAAVPGWERIGYPVAECFPDGTAVITKPKGTGGAVTSQHVAEQVLYEIGDPGAYLMADVVCDWRGVTLSGDGEDRVRVAGARGRAPTTTFKVTATRVEGYRALTTAMFAGADAAGKARRMAQAIVDRTQALLAAAGAPPLDRVSIEVVGGGEILGAANDPTATEVVVKIGVHGPDRSGPETFAEEFAAMGLVAQGMTGLFAGRPRVAPAFAVYHLLVDKSAVPVRVTVGDEVVAVATAPGTAATQISTPPLPEHAPAPVADAVTVPLRALARARSGDKGDLVNIGVLARRPEFEAVLYDQLTAERVLDFFAHLAPSQVVRWAVPGLAAINIVIRDVLGGIGGTSTLRFDPQGKSFAAMLLTLPVAVDRAWVDCGLLDAGGLDELEIPDVVAAP